MEKYKDILLEVKGGVARITINRPEKYNAFTPNTCEELIDAFKKAGWDIGPEDVVCGVVGDDQGRPDVPPFPIVGHPTGDDLRIRGIPRPFDGLDIYKGTFVDHRRGEVGQIPYVADFEGLGRVD